MDSRASRPGGIETGLLRELLLYATRSCLLVRLYMLICRMHRSRIERDQFGTEHMHMVFHVSGPANKGVVKVHMLRHKDAEDTHWATHSISLDVHGQGRIWIESADPDMSPAGAAGKSLKDVFGNEGKLFGVRIW